MTVLAYDVRSWFKNLEIDDVFEPTHLVKGRECQQAMLIGGRVATLKSWSLSLNIVKGQLCKGDALQWSDGGTQIGFAIGFAKAETDNEIHFVAFIRGCRSVSEGSWVRGAEEN